MKVIDVLRKVRATISEGWCKGWDARDKAGKMVFYADKSACQWCLVGAIAKAIPGDDKRVLRTLEEVALHDNCVSQLICTLDPVDQLGFSLTDWNDDPVRTQEDVLELVDKTISRLALPA